MVRKVKEKDPKMVNVMTIYGTKEEKDILTYLEKKHIIYGFSPTFEMYSKVLGKYVIVREIIVATTQEKIDKFMKILDLRNYF